MTPKERFMKVLNLEEPDQVPFADWVNKEIRQKLVKAMGADQMDEAEFAKAILISAKWIMFWPCQKRSKNTGNILFDE